MKTRVLLPTRSKFDNDTEVDAVVYLRRKGEHMLAVNVVKWRKGELPLEAFSVELMDIIAENDDILVGA